MQIGCLLYICRYVNRQRCIFKSIFSSLLLLRSCGASNSNHLPLPSSNLTTTNSTSIFISLSISCHFHCQYQYSHVHRVCVCMDELITARCLRFLLIGGRTPTDDHHQTTALHSKQDRRLIMKLLLFTFECLSLKVLLPLMCKENFIIIST